MGCSLGCFRTKDDGSRRDHLFSKLYSWKKRDLEVDRNQYTSVVSSEERGTSSEKAEREILEEKFDGDDNVNEELRQKAKFLKSCGAILETLIEIRKASVQQSAKPRDERKNTMDFRKEPSPSDKSPDEDRPIMGAAGVHWNGEEPSRTSPRQWDGNGIPNSTTKYKEDQKVNWHATPFEVRLEKVLSDEMVYPSRKLDGRLVELQDEGRE